MNIWVKGKEKLFRWDTAQQLILDAKDAKYVDFGTESTPIRVQVTNGTCPIPDEWLQTAGFKNLWICRADDTRECAML